MLYQKSATSHRVSSHGPTLTRLGDTLYARGVWRGSDPSSVTALLPIRFTSFSTETKHTFVLSLQKLFSTWNHILELVSQLRSKSLTWSSSLLQLNNASVSVIRSSLSRGNKSGARGETWNFKPNLHHNHCYKSVRSRVTAHRLMPLTSC